MTQAVNQIDKIVSRLGDKIKNLRKDMGLSLKDLSRRSGISAAAIHKIESNGITPTITTMMKVADSLGMKVSYFIEEGQENNDAVFVRKSMREAILTFKDGLNLQGISAKKYGDFLMTAAHAVVDVGASSGSEPMHYRGEELVYCLRGKMEFQVRDKTYLLGPGDSLHFRTQIEHSWKNTGKVPATLIWIHAIAPS